MKTLDDSLSQADIEQMFHEADRDLDGKIGFGEFIEMILYS